MYVYIIIFKGGKLGDAGGTLFLPYPKILKLFAVFGDKNWFLGKIESNPKFRAMIFSS